MGLEDIDSGGSVQADGRVVLEDTMDVQVNTGSGRERVSY